MLFFVNVESLVRNKFKMAELQGEMYEKTFLNIFCKFLYEELF